MTKAERAEVRALIAEAPKALAPIFESFMRAITALDEKDALIADALALLESGWAHVNWMIKTRFEYDEKLAALKARVAL